jgi:hypothetical protein
LWRANTRWMAELLVDTVCMLAYEAPCMLNSSELKFWSLPNTKYYQKHFNVRCSLQQMFYQHPFLSTISKAFWQKYHTNWAGWCSDIASDCTQRVLVHISTRFSDILTNIPVAETGHNHPLQNHYLLITLSFCLIWHCNLCILRSNDKQH